MADNNKHQEDSAKIMMAGVVGIVVAIILILINEHFLV